jgi:hypothetical protein
LVVLSVHFKKIRHPLNDVPAESLLAKWHPLNDVPAESLLAKLTTAARAKNLKYEIYCFENDGCNGEAWDKQYFYDRGTTFYAHYVVRGDDYHATVSALLVALNGPPNTGPEPDPVLIFDTGEVNP